MATVEMTEAELGARLRSDAAGSPKAVFRAMVSAAQRGKGYIVKKSPVDRGILRNAWKVIRLSIQNIVELTNDQPYAGVVERGARPFKISPDGLTALKYWAKRKLRSGELTPKGPVGSEQELEREANRIAWAIAKKFEKVGMKGKRFVMENLPILASLMDAEVKRYLGKFFNRQNRSNNG